MKEIMKEIMDEMKEMAEVTMEMCGCTFEETFPYTTNKMITMGGKDYIIEVKIKLA